ncbi:hypothetical protein MKX03_027895 [Papaver bracteatum]|nr:hypothetical protein MKX03_027892 [Papaver bracteatum]KAI3885705.1 hypothetical protein MKX03_027895 [Papaver bracteatum]
MEAARSKVIRDALAIWRARTSCPPINATAAQRAATSCKCCHKPVDKLREQERAKLREGLKVITDDIVNSEAKLHSLFLKWLAYNELSHFNLEDEKAFRERFGIFKDTARFINQHNKSGSPTICGLTPFADLTLDEFGSSSWKTYPKKPNQVIAGIPEYMDQKAN